jgi:L-ectoine synthase
MVSARELRTAMPIKIINKTDLLGGPRHIKHTTYETCRFLLDADEVGVTVTDIVMEPHVDEIYGYDDHVEIAYCIGGDATLTDIATGFSHDIRPGVMWVTAKGDRFRFVARVPTRLICVFTPAFSGAETGFAKDA